MALKRGDYKNQVLFLKGSLENQIKPDLKDTTVTVHSEEAEIVMRNIKYMQKELSYLQGCFVDGVVLDKSRLEMMLATLNTANNLYGSIMETCVNVFVSNTES